MTRKTRIHVIIISFLISALFILLGLSLNGTKAQSLTYLGIAQSSNEIKELDYTNHLVTKEMKSGESFTLYLYAKQDNEEEFEVNQIILDDLGLHVQWQIKNSGSNDYVDVSNDLSLTVENAVDATYKLILSDNNQNYAYYEYQVETYDESNITYNLELTSPSSVHEGDKVTSVVKELDVYTPTGVNKNRTDQYTDIESIDDYLLQNNMSLKFYDDDEELLTDAEFEYVDNEETTFTAKLFKENNLIQQELVTTIVTSHEADTRRENVVDSTCSKTGSYDEVTYCTICNKVLNRETRTIGKKDHTFVIDNAVPATIYNTGLTEGKHCSVCGEVFVAQSVTPKVPTNIVGETYTADTNPLVRVLTNNGTNKTVSIRDKSSNYRYVTVAETVVLHRETFKVTSLMSDCFNGYYVKCVTLPGTINNIESKAFIGDKKLNKINIKSTSLNVESGAFKGLSSKQKKKIKVYITKRMSKKAFNKLKAQLVREGLKASNIKRM